MNAFAWAPSVAGVFQFTCWVRDNKRAYVNDWDRDDWSFWNANGSPSKTAGSVFTVSAQNVEIKFAGTAIEYFTGGVPGSKSGWRVRVINAISGPQLPQGTIVEVSSAAVTPPWGYMDPSIKPGDIVEAYGLYSFMDDVWPNHLVSLVGSESYYLVWLRYTSTGGSSGLSLTVGEDLQVSSRPWRGWTAYPPHFET